MTLRLAGETDTDALLRLVAIAARKCRVDGSDLDLSTRQLMLAACRLHAVTVGPELARLHVDAAMDSAKANLTAPGAA